MFSVIRVVNVQRVRVAFAAFGKKETWHIRVRLICFDGLDNRERLAEIPAPGQSFQSVERPVKNARPFKLDTILQGRVLVGIVERRDANNMDPPKDAVVRVRNPGRVIHRPQKFDGRINLVRVMILALDCDRLAADYRIEYLG